VKHCEQAQAIGVDSRSVEDLKKLNKNKKLVKKLGERGQGEGGPGLRSRVWPAAAGSANKAAVAAAKQQQQQACYVRPA
jgi:hypothetical protein